MPVPVTGPVLVVVPVPVPVLVLGVPSINVQAMTTSPATGGTEP